MAGSFLTGGVSTTVLPGGIAASAPLNLLGLAAMLGFGIAGNVKGNWIDAANNRMGKINTLAGKYQNINTGYQGEANYQNLTNNLLNDFNEASRTYNAGGGTQKYLDKINAMSGNKANINLTSMINTRDKIAGNKYANLVNQALTQKNIPMAQNLLNDFAAAADLNRYSSPNKNSLPVGPIAGVSYPEAVALQQYVQPLRNLITGPENKPGMSYGQPDTANNILQGGANLFNLFANNNYDIPTPNRNYGGGIAKLSSEFNNYYREAPQRNNNININGGNDVVLNPSPMVATPNLNTALPTVPIQPMSDPLAFYYNM